MPNSSFTAAKCRAVLGWMDKDRNRAITKEEFVEFFRKIMRNYSQATNDKGIKQVTARFAAGCKTLTSNACHECR